MKAKNAFLEAKRYAENARKILSSKAGKDGDYYTDPKYVRMACSTAYTGMLLALDAYFGMQKKGNKRKHVQEYEKALAQTNKTILRDFNSAYNYLHLLGGYDGDLRVTTSQEGIKLAEKVIEWTKSRTEKVTDF